MRRLLVLTALLPLLGGGVAGGSVQAQAQATGVDRSPEALTRALTPALRERARAFAAHDVAGFMATVDQRDEAFTKAQRAKVTNAAALSFARYELTPVLDDIADLSRARDRQRLGPDTVLVPVEERFELAGGWDQGSPVVEVQYLTMTRDPGGRWRVASDTGAADMGLQSARHSWDFTPVRSTRSARVLVLHPPGQEDEARSVAEETEAALDLVRRVWTQRWSERVVVELPRDSAALGERIQATFPLDDFVAFAAATVDGEDLSLRFTGSRVLVNPDNFLEDSSASRQNTLAHELIHVASRAVSGVYLPSWLEEGIAQVLGEGASAVGTSPVTRLVARNAWPGRLPEDFDFVVGGTDRVYRSYAEAYLAVRSVERMGGRAGIDRLYVRAGEGGRLGPGTSTYRLDQAARAALGISLEALERRYAEDVRSGRVR